MHAGPHDGSSARSEDHHGYLPLSLRLVTVVTATVVVVDKPPEALEVRIVVVDDAGGRGPTCASNLHLDVRLCCEIEEPGGCVIITPLGGDHDIAVTVVDVHERVCASGSAAAASCATARWVCRASGARSAVAALIRTDGPRTSSAPIRNLHRYALRRRAAHPRGHDLRIAGASGGATVPLTGRTGRVYAWRARRCTGSKSDSDGFQDRKRTARPSVL